jgi:hypothetical protein
MATLDDVARITAGLPEVTEENRRGTRTWSVAGKTFAWERPYSKADVKRFGDETPPRQPILAVRVEDLIEKEAVLAAGTRGIFHDPSLRRLPRGPDRAPEGRRASAQGRGRRRLARVRTSRPRGATRVPALALTASAADLERQG